MRGLSRRTLVTSCACAAASCVAGPFFPAGRARAQSIQFEDGCREFDLASMNAATVSMELDEEASAAFGIGPQPARVVSMVEYLNAMRNRPGNWDKVAEQIAGDIRSVLDFYGFGLSDIAFGVLTGGATLQTRMYVTNNQSVLGELKAASPIWTEAKYAVVIAERLLPQDVRSPDANVDQFSAYVAHEIGHAYIEEKQLGVYFTQDASGLGRVLNALGHELHADYLAASFLYRLDSDCVKLRDLADNFFRLGEVQISSATHPLQAERFTIVMDAISNAEVTALANKVVSRGRNAAINMLEARIPPA